MNKNKISDFLTPDISYLLGLITGRGEIESSHEVKRILIEFPFKTLESKAISRVFDQKLYIQTSLDPIVLRLQNMGVRTQKTIGDKSISLTLTWQTEDISWLFIKFLINDTRFNFHDFAVPDAVLQTTDANKKEFLRGLADVTAYVRASNKDQLGRHRVYVEISNHNWYLPPQICFLLQSLGVPVQYIGYGHPNIRGGKRTSWAKEHQMKIYAEDFSQIGFYISHKNEALIELAEYNLAHFEKRQALCKGSTTHSKVKQVHEHEDHEKIPSSLKGKHFDNFREICKCLGCYLQQD